MRNDTVRVRFEDHDFEHKGKNYIFNGVVYANFEETYSGSYEGYDYERVYIADNEEVEIENLRVLNDEGIPRNLVKDKDILYAVELYMLDIYKEMINE